MYIQNYAAMIQPYLKENMDFDHHIGDQDRVCYV